MMRALTDEHPTRPLPRRYGVVRVGEHWAVEVSGCRTRPVFDRHQAEAVARRLQKEADGLARMARA